MNSGRGVSQRALLDFDGESSIPPMAEWNGGEALPPLAHSGLSTFEIERAYAVVKEDYRPFRLNVTTDPARYWAAAPGRRMRCIVTPTDAWNFAEMGSADAGNAGQAPARPWLFRVDATGASRANTGFQDAGLTFHPEVPTFAWVKDWIGGGPIGFGNAPNESGLEIGWWITHETGHSFGLVHDAIPTDDYFNGHGGAVRVSGKFGGGGFLNPQLWGPIMGDSGYLSQWSRGEFNNAQHDGLPLQDDVAILAAALGYVTDDNGTFDSATALPLEGSNFSGTGIISRTASGGPDEDYYRFTVPAPASVTILFRPAEPFTDPDPLVQQSRNGGIPNLMLSAELYRPDRSFCCHSTAGAESPIVPASPTFQEQLNPTEFLRRRITRNLDPGDYYLRVAGGGLGNPATNGFSEYGNMGEYSIAGSITYLVPSITSPLTANGTVSQPFTYQAVSSLNPVTWTATGLPANLAIHSGTGVISGTPATAGTFPVTLRAYTAQAYGEETLVISIGTPGGPVITAPLADTAEEGLPYSNQIVATGGATSYGVTGGTIPGLTVNPQTGAITGTPTTPGVWSMTLTASNSWSTTPAGFTLTVLPSPQSALDSAALVFTRTDAKKWFGQTAVSRDGVDAMQSPALGHGESSSIETTVTGPGTISYCWRTDSETGDRLTLSIGGSMVDTLNGNSGWLSRTQSVPAGVQTLRWNFARDAGGDGGSNTAWLDQVQWVAATGPVITSPLAVNWTAGQVATVNLTSNDPATVWTMSGTLPPGVFFIGNPTNVIGAVPWRPGTYSITLFATNSLGTTTRAFTMHIRSSYEAWAVANGLGAGSELGDPDRDGLPNIAELAFALDPFVRNNAFQPVSYDPVTRRLRATFNRRQQYYPDLLYEVQVSNGLNSWTTIARTNNGGSPENTGGALSITETQVTADPPVYEAVVIDGTAHSAATSRRSMRMKISQLPPVP